MQHLCVLKIDWQTRKTIILVLPAEFIKGMHQQLALALSVLFAYELVAELSIHSVNLTKVFVHRSSVHSIHTLNRC